MANKDKRKAVSNGKASEWEETSITKVCRQKSQNAFCILEALKVQGEHRLERGVKREGMERQKLS